MNLLEIPDNYDVLMMHGSGSGEFRASAVIFNLVAFWVEQRRRRAMNELEGDEDAVLESCKRDRTRSKTRLPRHRLLVT